VREQQTRSHVGRHARVGLVVMHGVAQESVAGAVGVAGVRGGQGRGEQTGTSTAVRNRGRQGRGESGRSALGVRHQITAELILIPYEQKQKATKARMK
jgi:hypothetical protein